MITEIDFKVTGEERKKLAYAIGAVNNMIVLKETLMRIIHSKSLFYWFILKVFDIQMVNSLFVYETVG